MDLMNLFDIMVKTNYSRVNRVVVAVESYSKAYDIFNNVQVILDPSDEVIENDFNSEVDFWYWGIWENGELISSCED